MIDADFSNKKEWTQRCIQTTVRMAKFSSDRCVMDYAEEIWGVEQVKVPEVNYTDKKTAEPAPIEK